MNTDRITTTSGFIASIMGILAVNGIYPQTTGFISALAGFITSYYTNKKSMPRKDIEHDHI